jgi:polyphosphate kinase
MGKDHNTENRNIFSCMQNRELSWLRFNERVLEEAQAQDNPLIERLKFVSIVTSNLDEFFMVRVGSLTDIANFNPDYLDNKTGMNSKQQLDKIYEACIPFYKKRDAALLDINSHLAYFGIRRMRMDELRKTERKKAELFFVNQVMPFLSPQIIDSRHPFPHIDNKHLHVGATLDDGKHQLFGLIPVPKNMDRMVFLTENSLKFVLLEDMILFFVQMVFEMYTVLEKTVIAVTRNADIDADQGFFDEDIDYRTHMQDMLKRRKRLYAVRLEIQGEIEEKFVKYFCKKFELKRHQLFFSHIPLDISYAYVLEKMIPEYLRPVLCFVPFNPPVLCNLSENTSFIQEIINQDVFLSYPYESMTPFLKLIREAINDVHTISIKITLYRIDEQSKLAEYLIDAAERGKEITVLMELRARFDEENNILWAQRLEQAGCRIIYGTGGYKVHSKICLITLQHKNKVQYITQVGTGNYNEKTAKLYTDFSFITADNQIGTDAMNYFRNMSIGNLNGRYSKLWVAPHLMKKSLQNEIDLEIEKAKNGELSRIILKTNAITDREMIEKLVLASQTGVKITLITRGICCIIPGVEGLTENINVISIVGRFLEHSRVFVFGIDHDARVYISSADLMTRNLERRVEIALPINNSAIKEQIISMLENMQKDTVKAREQLSDGSYIYCGSPGKSIFNSQEYFMKKALESSVIKSDAPIAEKNIEHSRLRKILRFFRFF